MLALHKTKDAGQHIMTVQSPPTHVTECMGVKVPPSPFLNETRIARINEARYEGQEIAGALSVVGPSDRVIEMGAGLGIVGAVTQLNARPEAMVSFEANPNMIPHIEALYALNKIKTKIKLHNKVLLTDPEPPKTVDFFCATASSAHPSPTQTNVRQKPSRSRQRAMNSCAKASNQQSF